MHKVLVVGATSKIAHETSKVFAATGAWLVLVGRNQAKLAAVAEDLRVRGAGKVEVLLCDLNHIHRHPEMVRSATEAFGGLDMALIAHGTLPDQGTCEQSVEETMKELTTNCLSVISILTLLANYFEEQRRGCIAVITSVAGDRGRQSNYVYGMAKGGVSLFSQGMRNRLFKAGVQVVTIKPGFVDTPMTASFPKNFLYTDAQSVGKRIYRSMMKGKDIVYIPWFWRWIMMVIKIIPEGVFKRTRL